MVKQLALPIADKEKCARGNQQHCQRHKGKVPPAGQGQRVDVIVFDGEGQVIEICRAVLRFVRFQCNVLLRIFRRDYALKYRLGQELIPIGRADLGETILGLAVRPKPFIGDGALSIRGKLAVLDVCGAGIALGDYVVGA